MSNASYKIVVLRPMTAQTVDIIDTSRVEQMAYTRKLNDVGNIQLTFRFGNDRAFAWCTETDLILDVYRDNDDGFGWTLDASFFLRYYDISPSSRGSDDVLIIGGPALEDLLQRRYIYPEDDPLGAGGFSTKAGDAAAVIAEYVREQCVSPATNTERAFPAFSIGSTTVFGINTARRYSKEQNLLDALKEISEQSDCDFWISRGVDAELIFNAGRRGTNQSVSTSPHGSKILLYTPERGNITAPRVSVDRREEVTRALVAAQGLEQDRLYVEVNDGQRENASVYNRIEGLVDSRDSDDNSLDAINDDGETFLEQNKPREEFEYLPDLEAAGGRYNIDWTLGDTVSGRYRGFEADMRISEVSINLNDVSESIDVTLKKTIAW